MRVVIALGGNALLQRGQPMTAANQRANISQAAKAIAAVRRAGHEVIVTHGNGPQIGLLAAQSVGDGPFPLDVLGAETVGMIGYVLQQELENILGDEAETAVLLTHIEVDPNDPAFAKPTKPIGAIYTEAEAKTLSAAQGWTIAQDGDAWRRVVPSPRPQWILEVGVLEKLVGLRVLVICAGGGGIPVVALPGGGHAGVEAVIDKDYASGLLARTLKADAFLMLTDVEAVYENWGKPTQRALHDVTVRQMRKLPFPEGSMGPKVDAAVEFATQTGGMAGIGALKDALRILNGEAGTRVTAE